MVNHLGRIAALLVACLAPARACAQTTWLVSNDPSENPDFASIGAAVASPSVHGGDTLLVSEGVGPYPTRVVIGIALTICGEPGESPVLVPAGSSDHIIETLRHGTAPNVFENLTFDSSPPLPPAGAGIWQQGTAPVVVRGCTFNRIRSRTVFLGGAGSGVYDSRFLNCEGYVIWAKDISIEVERCTFEGDPGANLGGTQIYKSCPVRECTFRNVGNICYADNSIPFMRFEHCRFESVSRASGPLFSGGGMLLLDCLVRDAHTGGSIIDIWQGGAVLESCTIIESSGASLAAKAASQVGQVAMRNCIVWDNAFGNAVILGANDVDYCILQSINGLAGTGNRVTDPLLDLEHPDGPMPRRGSPAIDSGWNNTLSPVDLAGRPRMVDDPIMPNSGFGNAPHIDVGAFEFQPPGPGFCQADLTTNAIAGHAGYGAPNGIVNNDDFFYYLSLFAGSAGCGAGSGQTRCLSPPDMTSTAIPGAPGYGILDGIINNDDFVYYLTLFAAGC